MPGSPQPIFPPEDINCSPQALEATEALLSEEHRALLAMDRARLAQATAVGAITLGQELGLSEDTVQQFHDGLIDRLANMMPTYHEYVNRLLGGMATTLASQHGVEDLAAAGQEPPANSTATSGEVVALHTDKPRPLPT